MLGMKGEVNDDILPLEGTVGLFTSRPGFCFFHFVRLFWNQIFICVSVKFKDNAKFSLSQTDKYLVDLNLFSSATSCSYVKAVRALLGLHRLVSSEPRFCWPSMLSSMSHSKLSPSVSDIDWSMSHLGLFERFDPLSSPWHSDSEIMIIIIIIKQYYRSFCWLKIRWAKGHS